jgi:hypothetical protein
MSRVVRGTLYGAVAVLGLDTIGALASRAFGFEYALLAPLSLLLYAAVGAYVGTRDHVARAAGAGALVGLLDATIGWLIAWGIGPGRPQPGERITLLGLFNTMLFVAVLAAVAATAGTWVARWVERRRRGGG